jgi:hypothetical protein
MTIVTATVTASVAPAIGTGTAIRGATMGATPDTFRVNPAAWRCRECVIRNEGHPHKEGGRETYDSFTQHWCSPSLIVADGEQRGVYAPQ